MTGETPGRPEPLSARQEDWIAQATEAVDRDFLLSTLERAVAIPSRTGEERALGEFFTETMNGREIEAFYQPIDERRGNSIGRLAGSGGGAELLFYGHLDTTFSADAREDAQMTGGRPRPDLEPRMRRDGDLLYGLGVAEPEGQRGLRHRRARCGGAGRHSAQGRGKHRYRRRRDPQGTGRGFDARLSRRPLPGLRVGCEYMLKHGLAADYCISTKPGYGIVWEEPGECWFKVTIMGELCYSGLRHIQPNRNPIVDAAAVVPTIEDWIADYTQRHTRGQIAPQGTVGGIEAGWPFKPEFIPGVCVLYVNIHTNAVTHPLELRREFEALIDDIRDTREGIDIHAEMLLSAPGSRTEPDNWIVRAASAAIEAVEGKPIVVSGLSGTTDGAILRNAGIATARIGLPGMAEPEPDWPPMFDACRIGDLERLTRVYLHALIDTCTRDREEMA